MSAGRILFITLSNIGDAIMTTPVLQALHDCFPEAAIDIIADERSSELFLYCPYRGRILHKEKSKQLRGVIALWKELFGTRYDLIVDLRTDGLAYLLRAGKRLTKWQRKAYGSHAVELHMGIIHALHGTKAIPTCWIWPGEENMVFARKVLADYSGKRLIGLGPGANWPGKIWPGRNYLSLIEKLRSEYDAVVLLGDADDRSLSAPIAQRSVLPCIDLCGQTALLQAAAVLKHLAVFVGNDSGLGHMASAVGTPSVTIFGPGQPARYRPWGDKALWFVGADQKIENVTVQDVTGIMGRHLLCAV
jgi:heptosyltransferase III